MSAELSAADPADNLKNQKDGYRQRNVRQRQKAEGWRYVAEAFYHTQSWYLAGPYTRQFCVYTKDSR